MQNRLKLLSVINKIRRAYKNREIILDYLPVRLWIELTNSCNLQCGMCPNSLPSESKRGFMSFDTFKKIIDQSSSHVYDVNLAHRGESLLHEQVAEMIAYAKRMGVSTRLNTNATLLSGDMARALIESGLDFISFSFDGIDPQTYEQIRSGARFENVMENITSFLKLKKELESITPYSMIEILALPRIEEHIEAYTQFKERFNDLPLDKITIKPPHNWGGNIDSELVGKENTGADEGGVSYSPCTNIWYSMVFLWDGSVALCVQDWYNDNALGNIDDNNIISMWNCETIVSVRELLSQEQYKQIEVCGKCDLLWRPAVKGVPKLNLINFLSDQLFGYGKMRKVIAPLERRLENTNLTTRRSL